MSKKAAETKQGIAKSKLKKINKHEISSGEKISKIKNQTLNSSASLNKAYVIAVLNSRARKS